MGDPYILHWTSTQLLAISKKLVIRTVLVDYSVSNLMYLIFCFLFCYVCVFILLVSCFDLPESNIITLSYLCFSFGHLYYNFLQKFYKYFTTKNANIVLAFKLPFYDIIYDKYRKNFKLFFVKLVWVVYYFSNLL